MNSEKRAQRRSELKRPWLYSTEYFLLARRATDDAHVFFQQAREEFDELDIWLVVFWRRSDINAERGFFRVPFHNFCLGRIGPDDD